MTTCSRAYLNALRRSPQRAFPLISSRRRVCWEECSPHHCTPQSVIRRATFRRWMVGRFARLTLRVRRAERQCCSRAWATLRRVEERQLPNLRAASAEGLRQARRSRTEQTAWFQLRGATLKIHETVPRHFSAVPPPSLHPSGLLRRKRSAHIFEGEERICRWRTSLRRLVR